MNEMLQHVIVTAEVNLHTIFLQQGQDRGRGGFGNLGQDFRYRRLTQPVHGLDNLPFTLSEIKQRVFRWHALAPINKC